MRFSAAIQTPQQPRTLAAAEFIRRLVSHEPAPRTTPTPARVEEPPADLDQRVRLVGEW